MLIAGAALMGAGWGIAAADYGITGHMTAHMLAVSVAAPLIAYGMAGTRVDPALRWPVWVNPLLMSLLELLVVWGWHVPAARAFASANASGLVLEQASFLTAGLLLWSACLGTRHISARRAAGIIALLLTTMHMTLLGVLITLAPRTLFGTNGFTCLGLSLSPLADQQLGGVIMLFVGAGSYLVGALLMLAQLLRHERSGMTRQCS